MTAVILHLSDCRRHAPARLRGQRGLAFPPVAAGFPGHVSSLLDSAGASVASGAPASFRQRQEAALEQARDIHDRTVRLVRAATRFLDEIALSSYGETSPVVAEFLPRQSGKVSG